MLAQTNREIELGFKEINNTGKIRSLDKERGQETNVGV